MKKQRKSYSADYKAKIGLEALKEDKTIAELSSDYGLHSNQIINWKKELKQRASEIFETSKEKSKINNDELINKLYQEIGRLKIELDWLKKKL